MAKKLVVGPDGSQSYVDTTPEEDAQAVTDAQAGTAAAALATAQAQRVTALKANARRQALVNAIQNSDDAQLITFLTNTITDLPTARTQIINLALLVAAVIRS